MLLMTLPPDYAPLRAHLLMLCDGCDKIDIDPRGEQTGEEGTNAHTKGSE
jgi:hypothetical protein